jgi:hypothetical protein
MLDYKPHISQSGEVETKLLYPEHPFPPHLCQKITRLSVRFQELALSKKLSIQFIDFLHLTVLSAQGSCEETGALSTTADEVLGISGLTTLERVLATALTTYNLYTERNCMTPSPSYGLYIQRQFRVLGAKPDILVCDTDAMEWAYLMIRATTEKDTDLWQWADARLRAMQVSDSKQHQLGRAFFPIPQTTSSTDFGRT